MLIRNALSKKKKELNNAKKKQKTNHSTDPYKYKNNFNLK